MVGRGGGVRIAVRLAVKDLLRSEDWSTVHITNA